MMMDEQQMLEKMVQMGMTPEEAMAKLQTMSPEEMQQMMMQGQGGPQQDFERFAKMQKLGNAAMMGGRMM